MYGCVVEWLNAGFVGMHMLGFVYFFRLYDRNEVDVLIQIFRIIIFLNNELCDFCETIIELCSIYII